MDDAEMEVSQVIPYLAIESLVLMSAAYDDICPNKFLITLVVNLGLGLWL